MEDSVAHLSKAHSLLTGRAFPFFDSVCRHLCANLLHISLQKTKSCANPTSHLFLLYCSFGYSYDVLVNCSQNIIQSTKMMQVSISVVDDSNSFQRIKMRYIADHNGMLQPVAPNPEPLAVDVGVARCLRNAGGALAPSSCEWNGLAVLLGMVVTSLVCESKRTFYPHILSFHVPPVQMSTNCNSKLRL